MTNIVKESFDITNKYLILATPLILFSLLSGLYILVSSGGTKLGLLIALVLFILMLAAFLSGWGQMLKISVTEPDREDTNSLLGEFVGGVGEYFLSLLGMVFCVFILSSAIFGLTYLVGMKFIGHVGISSADISLAMESSEALRKFYTSLSETQLLKLNLWNLLIFASVTLEYFLIMFFVPAILFKTKNPFKAFLVSIKDLFTRKFFGNVLLYTAVFIVYSVLSIFSTIFGGNVFIHFLLTLTNFYFLIFVGVLLFNYYYNNYVLRTGVKG